MLFRSLVWEILTAPDPTTPVSQAQLPTPTTAKVSLRPLLTGNTLLDTTLGFFGELTGIALFLYSLWGFFRVVTAPQTPPLAEIATVFGMMATAILLLYHANVMQKRYPAFGRGWQTGRNTWGGGVDIALNLLFGVIVLTVLFPLGALLWCAGNAFGGIAWLFVLAIVYGVGVLAQRMIAGKKREIVP